MAIGTVSRGMVAVRLFIVDDKTGRGVGGVPVSVHAIAPGPIFEPLPPVTVVTTERASAPIEIVPGPVPEPGPAPSPPAQSRPLATLQSDAAGYVSFKFDRAGLAGIASLNAIVAVVPARQQAFSVGELLAGQDTATLRIDPATVASAARVGLPSIMLPDARDLALSPASIGLIPQPAAGDLCQQLMPAANDARRFRVGQCSTCEITDPGRFWDWKESPCTETAEAAPSTPDPQKGQTVDDLKSEAITNMISFNNAPDVTAAALKDLITSLTNADEGSTVAKDALSKLLDTIKESLQPKKSE